MKREKSLALSSPGPEIASQLFRLMKLHKKGDDISWRQNTSRFLQPGLPGNKFVNSKG
jgi:hypothetical protein